MQSIAQSVPDTGEAPGKLADCARSNALVFGPGAGNDAEGWRRIAVQPHRGPRPCQGTLRVVFNDDGDIDPRFAQVDTVQSSEIRARQIREVPITLVDP